MAVNPPGPEQPAEAPPAPPADSGGWIEMVNLFYPWTQLNAFGVPPANLKARPEVMPTLSMLVGQVQGVPSLVAVDKGGRIAVTSAPVVSGSVPLPKNGAVAWTVKPAISGGTLLLWLLGAPQDYPSVLVNELNDAFTYWSRVPSADRNVFYAFPLPDAASQGLTLHVTQANSGPVQTTVLWAVIGERLLPWFGPPSPIGPRVCVPINAAPGAGVSVDLWTPQAGQTVTAQFLNFAVATTGVAAVNLEDDAGVIAATIRTDAVHAASWPLNDFAFTLGHKVRLHNTSGVAAGTIAGSLVLREVSGG